MIGANPEDLQGLSQALDAAGSRVDELGATLSRTFEAAEWLGAAAERFLSDWYRGFLPLLQQIGARLHELAGQVRFEADQQLRASSSLSGPVSSGGILGAAAGGIPWGAVPPIEREVGRLSDTWGPWVGPLLGAIPYVGPALLADQVGRIVQDGDEHHFRAAFDGVTNVVAPTLMSHFGVPGVVGGAVLVEADNVVDAAAAIHWRYTFEHLSYLNPLQPGALSAVASAEEAGFEKLGVQEVETGFAAAVSFLSEG